MNHPRIAEHQKIQQKLQRIILRILGLAIFLQCIYPLYQATVNNYSSYGHFLAKYTVGDNNTPLSQLQLLLLDRVLVITLLLSGWEVLRKRGNALALTFIFIWFAGQAALQSFLNNMPPYTQYTPINQALRYLTPLAYYLLKQTTKKTNPPAQIGKFSAPWLPILRIATAMTFIGHGLAAFWAKPQFVELINGTLMSIQESTIFTTAKDLRIEDEAIIKSYILQPIAALDFILSIIILIPAATLWKTQRWISLYLALWALITATSRVTAYSIAHWPEIIIRATYILAPLSLYFYFTYSAKFADKLKQQDALTSQEK